jgi:FkbM family methyltransferase
MKRFLSASALPGKAKRFLKIRVEAVFQKKQNRFLEQASGLIHIGANVGQERELYAKYGLAVLWIEPIPEIFEILKKNISGLPNQRAIQALVTDTDDAEYSFYIANNNGASSSIHDLSLHRDVWPEVTFERAIQLRSKTLPSLLEAYQIDPAPYDVLVLDTQGSELLVLQGAQPMLRRFAYIKTEAADFESYKDGCQLQDIESFLLRNGFREHSRYKFNQHRDGGSYYDIVYQNTNA